MAIRKPNTRVKATSLYYPNNDPEKKPDLSGQDVTNNQEPEFLIEPDEDEGGSTYYENNTESVGKGSETSPTPAVQSASAKKAKSVTAKGKQVKAAPSVLDEPVDPIGEGEDEDEQDEIDDAATEFVDGEETSAATDEGGAVGQADGNQNVGTIDNDINPGDGYIGQHEMTASEDDCDLDGSQPQQGLVIEGADDGDDEWETAPVETEIEQDEVVDPAVADDSFEIESEAEDLSALDAGDAMDIVDVDGMDDDGSGVAFANFNGGVIALRANRIVATMSRKNAIKAGKQDVFQTPQYQDVTADAMVRAGMRKGLKSMGFVMAKVNVSKAAVVNKRVEAKVAVVAASTRRVSAEKEAILNQSLAIASVGLNRGAFRGVTNTLRTALEQELVAAGVRGAEKLVRRVFASHGVAYAKSLVTVAQKLSNMPAETRASMAESLDMMSDDIEPAAEDNFVESNEFDGDDGFNEEVIDAPDEVSAALLRPAYAVTASSGQHQTQIRASNKVDPSIMQYLNGSAPLPFV